MKKLIIGLTLTFFVACHSKTQTSTPAAVPEKKFPLISVPATIDAPEARADYLAEHYWSGFDFTDTAYIHLPEITEQALADYIGILGHTSSPEIADRSIKKMMARAAVRPEVFDYFFDLYEKYLYDPNSPLRNEEYYISVLEAVLSSPTLSDAEKIRPEHQLGLSMKNRIGHKAADLTYTRADGTSGRLYDVQAPYILLFFYNPDCSTCRQVKESILASPLIGDLEKAGQLRIVAIYPDEDLEAWTTHLSDMPSRWMIGRDKEQAIREKEIYDLKAIPTLYLLDKNKTVLLKDADFAQIETYLKNN